MLFYSDRTSAEDEEEAASDDGGCHISRKKKRKGETEPGPPHRGVRPRVAIDQDGGQEDPMTRTPGRTHRTYKKGPELHQLSRTTPVLKTRCTVAVATVSPICPPRRNSTIRPCYTRCCTTPKLSLCFVVYGLVCRSHDATKLNIFCLLD
jgi:hypothetical protein